MNDWLRAVVAGLLGGVLVAVPVATVVTVKRVEHQNARIHRLEQIVNALCTRGAGSTAVAKLPSGRIVTTQAPSYSGCAPLRQERKR